MQIKAGVKIQGIKPEMILACQVTEFWLPGFTMTSCIDGKHSTRSKHKLGYAIDIRTRDISLDQCQTATSGIQQALGGEYFVLLETDHIHIQFNGSEIL